MKAKFLCMLAAILFLFAVSPQAQQNQFPSAGGSTAALGHNINGGSTFNIVSVPAAGSQASASYAAGLAAAVGVPGVRHVANCVTASAGAATAPTATILTVNLRDGATGTGTILWSTTIVAAATAAQHGSVSVCGLHLMGSQGTAMTLEFSAALASEQESVALSGFDVQ